MKNLCDDGSKCFLELILANSKTFLEICHQDANQLDLITNLPLKLNHISNNYFVKYTQKNLGKRNEKDMRSSLHFSKTIYMNLTESNLHIPNKVELK